METTARIKRRPTTADWMNILLAVWMVVSPAVLGFGRHGAARWNNVAVGIALVLLNWVSLNRLQTGMIPGLIVFIAAWIFLSPFVLDGGSPSLLWNNLIMAFVLVTGAAIAEQARLIRSSHSPAQEQ